MHIALNNYAEAAICVLLEVCRKQANINININININNNKIQTNRQNIILGKRQDH